MCVCVCVSKGRLVQSREERLLLAKGKDKRGGVELEVVVGGRWGEGGAQWIEPGNQ